MRNALEASVPPVQSEQLRSWLLLDDQVLAYQASVTVGVEGLKTLAAEYLANSRLYECAKIKFAESSFS